VLVEAGFNFFYNIVEDGGTASRRFIEGVGGIVKRREWDEWDIPSFGREWDIPALGREWDKWDIPVVVFVVFAAIPHRLHTSSFPIVYLHGKPLGPLSMCRPSTIRWF